MNIRQLLICLIRPNGKIHFLSNLKPDSRILDVGCGNNSPYLTKKILPNCHYTGIDISNYNQSKLNLANRYIVTTPKKFSNEILKLRNTMDAVVSSHNIEHCNDREKTMEAIMQSLKKGGKLYISFPSEFSISFPKRNGTLNYYDDDTHKEMPPNFDDLIKKLESNHFKVIFSSKRYQPVIPFLFGFLLELISKFKRRVFFGTWEYYGFESIIIAKKLN
jgi:SAM-dependent methyltransferase